MIRICMWLLNILRVQLFASIALMTALRGRGPSVAEVCEDNLSAIAYLANDAAGRAHLRDYGACEGA